MSSKRGGWPVFVGAFVVAFFSSLALRLGAQDLRMLVLDNGMRVLLLPQPSARMVASVIVVRSGLRDETAEVNGVSHLLEHLLFNGTERRTQKQIYDEMDAIGAYNNAHTASDHTTFMVLAPTEQMRRALDVQADMLFHSTLPPEKLEKERGIVLREIDKDRGSPAAQLERAFRTALLAGSPYAWPVLGPRRVIESIPRQKIYEFYRAHYVPNNMVAILVGGFEPDSAMAVLEEFFGNATPGVVPERPKLNVRPPSRDVLFESSVRSDQVTLRLGTVRLAAPLDEVVALEFGAELLNASVGSWSLLQSLRQRFGSAVRSASVDFEFHPGLVVLTVNVQGDSALRVDELFAYCCDFLRGLDERPVPDEELESVKLEFRTQEVLDLERPHYWGMLKAPYIAVFGPEAIVEHSDLLASLSARRLREVWAEWPGKAHFLGMFSAPTLGNSTRKTAGSQGSTVVTTLPNGMTLIVEQNRASELFAASLIARNRKSLEPEGKDGIADILHRIMGRSTRLHPNGQLEKEFERIGARVQVTDMPWIPYDDYYTQPDFSFVRVECLAEYGSRALELLAEMLREPNLTQDELAAARQAALGGMSAREMSPSYRSSRLFTKELFGRHPFGRPILGTRETITRVSLDDLRRFARVYLAPTNLVLAVVSPEDPETIRRKVQEWFPSNSATPSSVAAALPEPVRGIRTVEDRRGSGRAYLRIGNLIPNVKDEDLPALRAAAQVLSSRLSFDLREKRGWAYSIGFTVQTFGRWGVYQAWMNLSAENLDQATQEIRKHIRRLREGVCSPDELERAVNQLRSRYAMRLLRSVNRAFYAAQDFHRRGRADWTARWLQELERVRPEDVRRAAKRYISADDLLVVRVD